MRPDSKGRLSRRLAAAAIWFSTSAGFADSYPRQPGVDILHYCFELTLNNETDRIDGRATIVFATRAPDVERLTLDLVGVTAGESGGGGGMVVQSVDRRGAPTPFTHAEDRLIIPLDKSVSVGDRREVVITYRGIPSRGLVIAENRHGDRTFFGDSFPDRARHWLPTLDHPSDKATCEFIVTAPDDLQVIATGVQIEETILPNDRRLTHFREDVPLSTYLMVIGAAPFAVQRVGEFVGVPIETWVFRQDRDAGFHDFAPVEPIIAFFDSRIGDYPFAKLANVQSKTQWGGMENAGNIFYNERSVTGERRVMGTIVHEIAHQWFGDSVTTADWNHVWLSEGFATYFTHVYNEFTYGRDHMARGLKRDRGRVIGYWMDHPDLAIVDESIPIDGILSTNSYQKGSWVLHMLRREVGEESFREGIRSYYRRFRNANVLTDDFRQVMEEASGQDLEWFFEQWIYWPGQPALAGEWRHDDSVGEVVMTIRQTQEGPVFRFPLDLALIADDAEPRIETVRLDEREQSFTFRSELAPGEIRLDPDTWLLFEAGDFAEAGD